MSAKGTTRRPFWVGIHVGVAAMAMVATLPGRTHGLGLVTEPLLQDLALDRVGYAALNLWATLIGSVFCLPVGWLIDRLGVRIVLTTTLAALGAVVVRMADVAAGGATVDLPAVEAGTAGGLSWVSVPQELFVLVLLTRGLGQSALSVVSLALMGKAAGEKPGLVVGFYSFLVAVGFMAAFIAVKQMFEQRHVGWRELWAGMGWVLIAAAAFALAIVRSPRAVESATDGPSTELPSATLGQALLSPAFWVFALATSFYGLVAAGLSLFNQSVLAERNFDRAVFLTITTVSPLVGLAANLLAGYLARFIHLGRLLAAALLIQGAALAAFPYVETLTQVYAYAVAMGVAGGILTVVFFTVWSQAYGPAHLGKIQGVAQLLTVLASAAGPLALAAGQRHYGSYGPLIQQLAVVSVVFALAGAVVPLPKRSKEAAV